MSYIYNMRCAAPPAFGGKGLLWFTYWSPEGSDQSTKWEHALINADGSRDPHYDMVKRVNAQTLERCQENNQKLAVLCINLDRFKDINDVFGHAVGDELLKEIAERLPKVAHRSDVRTRG